MRRILASVLCLALPLLCRSADIKHDPPTYRPNSCENVSDTCMNDICIWSADHFQRPLQSCIDNGIISDSATCAAAHTIVDACAEDFTDSLITDQECLIIYLLFMFTYLLDLIDKSNFDKYISI